MLNCFFDHVYTLRHGEEEPGMDVPTARRIQELTHLPGATLRTRANPRRLRALTPERVAHTNRKT